jgi:hypothetical protein
MIYRIFLFGAVLNRICRIIYDLQDFSLWSGFEQDLQDYI